jgi:TetR/AcrR family transcriptional repressor of bet genes
VAAADGPRARLRAIVAANFANSQFTERAVRAWLAFWSEAPYVPTLQRLQRVNAARLHSNLCHELKQLLAPDEARRAAIGLAALIDGLSLRAAMAPTLVDADDARQLVLTHADALLGRNAGW